MKVQVALYGKFKSNRRALAKQIVSFFMPVSKIRGVRKRRFKMSFIGKRRWLRKSNSAVLFIKGATLNDEQKQSLIDQLKYYLDLRNVRIKFL